MSPARVDLADMPIIDHHMHSLLKADQPLDLLRYQGFFAESSDPVIKEQFVPDTIIWQWAIRDLASYFQCEPTPEAVFEARSAVPLDKLANDMWHDQGCEALFVDYYGFQPGQNYAPQELRVMLNNIRVEPILRLETFAQDLIMQHEHFVDMVDAFSTGVAEAHDNGHLALKSIIAYHTGLDIDWVSEQEAARAYGPVREQAKREGKIRLVDKTLCDYLVVRALEIANREALPVQFHTGFGDPDLDANPLRLSRVLQSGKFPNVPFVLLHAGWPYVRQLSYMCAKYPNVYMDLSLAIPFVTTAIPIMIHEALSLAPVTKIMYGSDGYSIPELFWVANKWGRAALQKVFGEIVDMGALTIEQAQRAGWRILGSNARHLYGL